MHDPVGVDVEGDLDLRDASGRRRQVDELELAERLVVHGHLPLALEDVDLHGGLAVLGGGKHLGAPRRDGRVALDQLGHYPTLGLDAERERSDVEQQDVLDLTLEHAGLDGGTHGHHLVGIDPLVGLAARHRDDQLLDGGHTGRPTDEHHVVDLGLGEAGVGDRLLERAAAGVYQVGGQLLKLGPGQLEVQVLRTGVGRGDERQVDGGLLHRGQLDLGLLGRFLKALQGHLVGAQVHPVGVLEGLDQPADHSLVPVVATEMGVPAGGLDLEDPFGDLEHRYVERAAAEVEHQDGLLLLLVQSVGERGRGRLVDDAQDLEAGDLARLLGGGALGVVEVGRNGDHRLVDSVAEVTLGIPLELLQDPGRDLLGVVALPVDVDAPAGVAHVPLDRSDGAVRIGDGLAFGHLTDENLVGLGEADDRRRGTPAFGVGDNGWLTRLENADDRVGGAEVDADGLGHRTASV